MLKVDTVNSKITNSSNIPYESRVNSFGNNPAVQQAYLNMNRDVYVDYVDGDISLLQLLAGKLRNFVSILNNQDPKIEIKARMIEEGLKQQAQRKLSLNTIA